MIALEFVNDELFHTSGLTIHIKQELLLTVTRRKSAKGKAVGTSDP